MNKKYLVLKKMKSLKVLIILLCRPMEHMLKCKKRIDIFADASEGQVGEFVGRVDVVGIAILARAYYQFWHGAGSVGGVVRAVWSGFRRDLTEQGKKRAGLILEESLAIACQQSTSASSA